MVDTVRTETELLTNLFQAGQPDESVGSQDMRDFIVSAKYLNDLRWEFHLDSEYTSAAPRAIAAGVRTKITIDGLTEDTGHPIPGHIPGHFWDPDTNKILPILAVNDFIIARFAVTGQSDSASVNRFEFEVDMGASSFPVIFQETAIFGKGAGNDQSFNFMIPLFIGPDFLTNGAELFITPLLDASFHTFAITIVRVYAANPNI